MTTRHGKIARLPNDLREELNRRLFNGEMGPELLAWLNQLPAVKEILSRFFDGALVNRQNLSDWRHGGYQDWLRHQEHELRIQRISEEGAGLKQCECNEDLFENFARIAVAELMVDMDSLDKMDGEQRWNRLRGLTRELARLQNGYNRSRWTELAWTKRNDQIADEEPFEEEQSPESNPTPNESNQVPELETENPKSETQNEARKVDQGASKGEGIDNRIWVTRVIYRRRGCGCICRNCHPDDGEYPYAEAVKDATEAKQRGVFCFWRGHVSINTVPTECNCVCGDCGSAEGRNSAPVPSALPSAPHLHGTTNVEGGTSPDADKEKVSAPEKAEATECITRFDPVADFLRQTTLWRAKRE